MPTIPATFGPPQGIQVEGEIIGIDLGLVPGYDWQEIRDREVVVPAGIDLMAGYPEP
jgi:hypothetical protein